MSKECTHNSSGGIGIAGALTIIFVLCKIFGFINWSWWVVFSPLIVSFSLLLLILGVAAIGAGILYFMSK